MTKTLIKIRIENVFLKYCIKMEIYTDSVIKKTNLNIDTATIFKHNNDNGLISRVLIESMFIDKNENDIFTIGILLQTGASLYWYAGINDKATIDEKRIAHQVARINDIPNEYSNGLHYGDCTNCASTCDRCLYENCYLGGVTIIHQFNELEKKNADYNADINITKLIAILLYAEKQENTFFTSLETKYEAFKICDEEEKNKYFTRAREFRRMMDDPPIVAGIPWW